MMASSKRRVSSAPGSANVNLYCAQCEAQIGIFDNEWIRLTSSYARSKEKGTHFGTEVGQRTQIVPGGPLPRTAEGCEMAEVFCRKCSNMVGQYCKKAPDASKQPLVDQYFYKLSRTFLKNSQTNMRVEPVFGYSPETLESISGSGLSTGLRESMTPSSRWMNTPLREASRTPSIQTATRNTLRNPSAASLQYEKPVRLPSDSEYENFEAAQQAMDILKQELAAQNSMLREHSTRLSNQAGQVSDHEGRLRDQDARVEDQEKCIRAQASRILDHEDTIEDQRRLIELQQTQLAGFSDQLTRLQKSIDDLKTSIQEGQSENTTQQLLGTGQVDFIGSFELMVRAMRDAQSTTEEVLSLRKRNQDLQNRLDSVTGVMDTIASRDVDGEEPSQSGVRDAQVLGKRKRGTSDSKVVASSRPTESPAIKERRLVRFEEQSLNQTSPQSPQQRLPSQNPTKVASGQLDHSLKEHSQDKESSRITNEKQAEQISDRLSRSSKQQELASQMDISPDETLEDRQLAETLQMFGASIGPGRSLTPALDSHTNTNLTEAAHSTPDPNFEVPPADEAEKLQDSSAFPGRMNTRASTRAIRRGDVTVEQDLAEATHSIQGGLDSPETPKVFRSLHSPQGEQGGIRLPSVQAAGKVLGINLEPLQALHQAFVVTPDPKHYAASPSLPLNTASGVLSDPSSMIQSGFTERASPLETPAPGEPRVLSQPADQLVTDSALASQNAPAANSIFVEDNSMFDDNVEFSDDTEDEDMGGLGTQLSSTDRGPNRRVTDTWIDRDKRSMAPEPSKRRKTVSNAGPKYVSLDRLRMATPQTWSEAISKGLEPKLARPPPINRRELDLHAELTMLGLAEWIPRNKRTKEYRDVVAAARAKYRNARLAEVLQEKGLSYGGAESSVLPDQTLNSPDIAINKPILSPLQNPPATSAPQNESVPGDENSQPSQPTQDKGIDLQPGDDPRNYEAPRLTRARARRSSASLDAGLDNPDRALQGSLVDAEGPSNKLRSGGRNSRQRKSDQQPSATSFPDADLTLTAPQQTVTGTIEVLAEATTDSQAPQPPPLQKQGRGRPRKVQASVPSAPDATDYVQEDVSTIATPSEMQVDGAVLSSIPFPPQRQKLLDSMRSRAQQKEEAIAARDLMAKQAMEAMEREGS